MGDHFPGDTDHLVFYTAYHVCHKKICRNGSELAVGAQYLYFIDLLYRDIYQDIAYGVRGVKGER